MGETYEGGRDFDALKEHATNNLKARCGDTTEELCTDEEKVILAKLRAMGWRGRKKIVTQYEQAKAKLEAEYEAKGEKIQKKEEKVAANTTKYVNEQIQTPEYRLLTTIPGVFGDE